MLIQHSTIEIEVPSKATESTKRQPPANRYADESGMTTEGKLPFDILFSGLKRLKTTASVFADDADFRFQMDAVSLFDPGLHFMDDVEDVLGRGMARIDDEAGMFRRYLGIAAGQAF